MGRPALVGVLLTAEWSSLVRPQPEHSTISDGHSMIVVKIGAVLYVKDLRRMRSFYRTGFQMDVVDDAREYSVLGSEPLALSLVKVPERIARTIVVCVPPLRRADVPLKLTLTVDSIEVLRPLLAELGGVV